MHIFSLIFLLFIVAVVILIASFITKYFYGSPTNFNKDDYFQSKYGARLAYLTKDGHSEKEAYEKIVVERDKEGREKLFWALFWAGMAVIAALFPNLI